MVFLFRSNKSFLIKFTLAGAALVELKISKLEKFPEVEFLSNEVNFCEFNVDIYKIFSLNFQSTSSYSSPVELENLISTWSNIEKLSFYRHEFNNYRSLVYFTISFIYRY